MPSLPQEKTSNTSDKGVTSFFDNYFDKKLTFPTNQVDAVIAYFQKRGFDKNASLSVSTVLLQQAKLDNVNVFKLLDTLKGLNEVQLSAVVTEILNYNRPKTSTLGYKRDQSLDKVERRNIKA
jgi:predicted metal-dependent phosphotriesterase family hydrolase